MSFIKKSENIKESFYPEFWNDDVRMEALYAPFRVRTLNPINYDAKLKFWKEMILKYCLKSGTSSITINQLKLAFLRKDCKPYVFDTVTNDMFQSGELKLKSDFMELPQHSWTGWAINSMMKKPLKWGFNKIKSSVVQTRDDNTEYIVTEALQNNSNKIRNHMEHLTETVMSLADAYEKCSGIGLTVEGIYLAIHQLDHEQKVFIDRSESIDDNKKIIIKFAAANQKTTPISELERSIYKLESTEKHLTSIIEHCECEIHELDINIRALIKDGKRNMAKSSLRKKKLLEKNLDKRTASLDHIQILLSRIHDTTNDSHILGAYKLGTATLKNILSDSGITLDNVDEALSEVHETLEMHDDIKSTIGSAQFGTDIDDSELEKELANLIEEKEEEELKDVVNDKNGNELNEVRNFDDSIERRLRELRMDVSQDTVSGPNNKVDQSGQF